VAAKFRKRAVVIEAVRWDGTNPSECLEFMAKGYLTGDGSLEIFTMEGTMRASRGDWIIKGTKGEFYPCKPDIFEEIYERVEE